MYEVGLSQSFVAWHVMPDMEGPESELHSHEYRLDVVIRTEELDEHGMVCDLDVLAASLSGVVETVEDKNLELIQPPEEGAVTVEVFARWAHTQLARALPGDGELSVRVWESPAAFGGYAGPISSS